MPGAVSTVWTNRIDWYKDAVIYEVHVRAYADSNGDGVGDFRGLTSKLGYLHDLGVTAVWVLPFYPSPLRDDGYDIANYKEVHPAYGTLNDFKTFLREAHRLGLRVITELVVNHTSDQHPWFQRARRAEPGSPERDFYIWSDTPHRFKEARVIFKDYEASNWSWDPVARVYYWHRFYSHQPDLNFDNPLVREAILDVVDFWLGMGVDGLRLDAVPYLYEREDTTGENLAETHAFLKELRGYVDARYPNRMLLAEANQWPEDAVAYFGQGDECHMAFHFPLMPRLFMAIRREDRFPVIDIMAQTPDIPANSQWALFLRNHDELTLEMVTDEERLYMYRAYGNLPEARVNLGIRRRFAPLLRNDRRRMELMNALLFSLPGTPIIYYGDEIGMGDNIYLGDRNGVRTPMQWSADRNAGFSRANPQQLYLPLIVDHEYHYETLHVEAQQSNPHSLLEWTRRLIALRKHYRAFGRGSIRFLHPENRKVLAFIRAYEDEKILVVANLSRFVQHVELDLSDFKGMIPMDLFGRVEFPEVGELPYFITLGPHGFYWFSIEPEHIRVGNAPGDEKREIPRITVSDGLESIILGKSKDALADVLLDYLCGCRWFRGYQHSMLSARIVDATPLRIGGSDGSADSTVYISLVRVYYAHHDPELYMLPLAHAVEQDAAALVEKYPRSVVARIGSYEGGREGDKADTVEDGIVYDAIWNAAFVRALAGLIVRGEAAPGPTGSLQGVVGAAPAEMAAVEETAQPPRVVDGELNNTSVVFDDALILKFFRLVDEGPNPEVETEDMLTRQGFAHIAPIVGWLEYKRPHNLPIALASLEHFVPNEGSVWDLALKALDGYFRRVVEVAQAPGTPGVPNAPDPQGVASRPTGAGMDMVRLLELAEQEPGAGSPGLLGDFSNIMRLLGQRTAEMHAALASDSGHPDFCPSPFTTYSQRSLYQTMRHQVGEALYELQHSLQTLPPKLQAGATAIIEAEPAIHERIRPVLQNRIQAQITRMHGDYRLSQVLYAGGDLVIVDFEGEARRLLAERRLKGSPLADLASMLCSIHNVAWFALPHFQAERESAGRSEELEERTNRWVQEVAAAFLRGYLSTAAEAPFVPRSRENLLVLLDTLLLKTFLGQLSHAIRARPEWLPACIVGTLQVLGLSPELN